MNNKKLEEKIMDQIKKGKIKVRSKYVFLAEKLGIGSAFVLSFILAILFFNLILFYLKTSDNLKYLSFGSFGFLAFLDSFPYLLVVSFIILLVIIIFIFSKTRFSYKKSFRDSVIAIILLILIGGGVLAYTDFSKNIEENSFNRGLGSVFRPFLQRGMEMRDRGMAGRIYQVAENYLIVETPHGQQKISLEVIKEKQNFKKGDFIISIGERRGDLFIAFDIKVLDPSEMPMIGRGIHRRFDSPLYPPIK